MTREDIEFSAAGTILRGWFYPAEGAGEAHPTIVMAHGFSAVKEMHLDKYAEAFAAAGLNALVYDHRNFGASDGQPRQEIDPWAQINDYRHAITYATTRPDVDSDAIGIWGSSYSGGHVQVVGALDRRVKAVVSQGMIASGYQNFTRLVRSDFIAGFRAQFDEDRLARFNGAEPAMVPVVSEDPLGPAALPTPDSYEWFTHGQSTMAPAWRNEVTLRSVEMLSEYEPASYIKRVSPTPLLMLPARGDHLCPVEFAVDAYEEAREPKRIEILPGGHFDIYTIGFERSSTLARDWFVKHLGVRD